MYNLGMSKSTVYRHLKNGYLSIVPLDMPRTVKFKPRTPRKASSVPNALKVGRTHEDFLFYIKQNNIVHWVEMDTVIGRVGEKQCDLLNSFKEFGTVYAGNVKFSAWGIGAVGSAFEWHSKGQGFESPMLHHNVRKP